MSTQVKRRREAASFLSAYIGAQGELIVDTTNNRVQVHDGSTAGGFPAARLAEVAGLAPVQSVAGRTGAVTLAITDVSGAAPLASPALTGTPTAPTPTTSDNSTKIATTAWVAAQGYGSGTGAVTSVAGRTGAVTLSVSDISGAAPLASPALTGNPTAPTQTAGDSSTKLATTAFVAGSFLTTATASATYAPLASPALTGTPTAPNAAAGTNTAQIATTSFVAASFVTFTYAAATYATVSNATLTGTPTAPTAAASDNSTKIATTAYVTGAAAALFARKSVSDAAYGVLATDRLVALTALTASRTMTLPAASAYPLGATLTVVDESGACSTTNTIILAAAGTDTINGASSQAIATANGYLAIESNGSGKWTVIDQTPSSTLSALTTVAQSASGANMQFGVLEQLITLSGASVTSTIQIPNRALVFAVSSRTVTAVTGAPSYGVGVSGNTTQFGGGLGASAGSNNSGVIGPTAFYSATSLVITATSGSFTGGQVRVAIQYLLCGVPTS